MSLPRMNKKAREKYLPPMSNPSYQEKIMALEEAILAKEVEMEKLDTTIWSNTADESIINAYSIKEFKGSIQTSKPIYWTGANPAPVVTWTQTIPVTTTLYLEGDGFSGFSFSNENVEPDQEEDDWYGF